MFSIRHIGLVMLAVLTIAGQSGNLSAQERFEVTSIKKVRPTIVNTIAALEKRDVEAARDAFEAYDSLWNGIEVYVNVRSRPMYQDLEHGYQARITKGLEAAAPDTGALLKEAQGMLVKFDELVVLIEKAPPLNARFDDVARLRIVRAHLREVNPALKAGKIEKARKSFKAFDDNWDSIEELIKERSKDDYVAIEKGMIDIEKALEPDKPDVAKTQALVNEVMRLYNVHVAEIQKEARSRM